MPKLYIWILVLCCGGIFTLCDSLSANWGKTGHWQSMAIVIVLAPFTYLLFGLLNQKVQLGIAGSLVNLIIVVGTVLVGTLYFQETMTFQQLIGLAFAVAAIVLLNI